VSGAMKSAWREPLFYVRGCLLVDQHTLFSFLHVWLQRLLLLQVRKQAMSQ
jgi:hypothetical protein